MSPHLSISIPLILLGRRDTFDPANSSTEPLNLILQTLQSFCHNICIVPFATDASLSRTSASADEAWAALGAQQSTAWILRPAPCANEFLTSFDAARGWERGDGHLTSSESKKLGRNVWSCGFLLVRFGVPSDTSSRQWTAFVQEMCEILGVLKRAFVEFEAPTKDITMPVKYWDVVVGERCFLRATARSMDVEVAKKVLMLHASFEKELDSLKTLREVVRFAGVSRWLEGMLLRRLAGQRREARTLGNLKVRQEVEFSGTKGEEGRWWDVVRHLDNDEIVADMQTAEENGLRLGVSVRKRGDGTVHMTAQGQRSSLDPERLITYIEVLAESVFTAQMLGIDELVERIEQSELYELGDLIRRCAIELDCLPQSNQNSGQELQNRLLARIPLHPETDNNTQPSAAHVALQSIMPQRIIDPFYNIRSGLAADHLESKEKMVHFMRRYEEAGGYMRTNDGKLCAMLDARRK